MNKTFLLPSLLAGLAVAQAPARAQDIAAFTDASRSAIHYTVAPVHPLRNCASLRTAAPGDLTVLSATAIPAASGVPAHCQLDGLIAPEIGFQINLPDNWNRRFYMFGNGGYAGETADTPPKPLYRDHALAAGFATAWTNTGHDARREPLASFAASQAKLVDYAFRAVHLTAVTGKRFVTEYYGHPAATSYWDGCSTGGRQGLMEAQRFPYDFDGVLAGAPVERFVDSQVVGLWNGRAVSGSGLTLDKLKTAGQAAYAKCADPSGLIVDPRRCDFNPARDVRQCPPGVDDGSCLTAGQAAAMQQVYTGVVSKGAPYFFGYAVGAEGPGTNFTGRAGWKAAGTSGCWAATARRPASNSMARRSCAIWPGRRSIRRPAPPATTSTPGPAGSARSGRWWTPTTRTCRCSGAMAAS